MTSPVNVIVWLPVFVPDKFDPVTVPVAATLVGVIAPRLNAIVPDVVIGAQLKLDGSDATKTMAQFKKDVKDAEAELLNMSKQFGATSKEALNAANKVALLNSGKPHTPESGAKL